MLYIVRMNVCNPFITVFCVVRRPACKSNSTVIQVGNLASGVAHPDKRRGGIGHHTEAFFALAQNSFGLPFARSLQQQARDQQGLGDNQDDGNNNVFPVALPKGRLPGTRLRPLPATPIVGEPPVQSAGRSESCTMGMFSSRSPDRPAPLFPRLTRPLLQVTIRSADAPMIQSKPWPRGIGRHMLCDRSEDINRFERGLS